MIKKSGYLLLAVLAYGIVESLFLGYSYYIAFSAVLFFVVSSDILLFNRRLGRDIFDVSATRVIPGNTSRKLESFDVNIIFKNNSKRGVHFHYFDTLSDVFKTAGDYEGFIALEPGEEIERTYSMKSIALGKYNIGPIKVYTQDPMKICISEYVVPTVDEIKIAPSLVDIHTQRSERLSNFIFYSGVHYSRKVGQGYDFYNVRQYSEGDDLRYVAWNRYGLLSGDELYIRQMEEEKPTDVIFVMDYSYNVNQGTLEKRMYDRIVNTVINAAHTIVKNHDGVGFVIESSTHHYFISPTKNTQSIDRLENIVSGIRPEGTFSITDTMKIIKDNVKKNSLIFMLTPFSHPESFPGTKPSDYKIGKRVFLFLVDPSELSLDFDNPAQNKLLASTRIKEMDYLSNVSRFFNSVGIKSSIATESKLLVKIMYEYRYGKMTNEGY